MQTTCKGRGAFFLNASLALGRPPPGGGGDVKRVGTPLLCPINSLAHKPTSPHFLMACFPSPAPYIAALSKRDFPPPMGKSQGSDLQKNKTINLKKEEGGARERDASSFKVAPNWGLRKSLATSQSPPPKKKIWQSSAPPTGSESPLHHHLV